MFFTFLIHISKLKIFSIRNVFDYVKVLEMYN